MKLNISKISIPEYLNQFKFTSILINLIPFVFFFCIRKINKLFAYKENNLVVISLHRLGDTIFTIPAIKEIQKHTNHKIIIACYPESKTIYQLAIDDVIYCEVYKNDFLFSDRLAKIKVKNKIKSFRPSIIVDLLGSMSSASLLFNVRAKKTVGTNKRLFRALYDNYVEFRKTPQLKDIYLDIVSTFIQVDNRNKNIFNKLSHSISSGGKILVQPFAGWREKEWSMKKYIELVKILQQHYEVSFLIPYNHLQQDVVAELINLDIDINITDTIEKLIDCIKGCSLFIGNDSGPINIANFLGKPTLTIYGSTNPEFTTTWEEHQPFVQKIQKCSAKQNEKFCITWGLEFACSGVQCMNLLTVEEVYLSLLPLVRKFCNKKRGISEDCK